MVGPGAYCVCKILFKVLNLNASCIIKQTSTLDRTVSNNQASH